MAYEDSSAPQTLDEDLPVPRVEERRRYIDGLIGENKEAYRAAFGTEGLPADEEARALVAGTTAALILLDVEGTIGFALPHSRRKDLPSRHDPLVRLNWAIVVDAHDGPPQEEPAFIRYEVYATDEGVMVLNGLRERLGMPSVAEERLRHQLALRRQADEIQARLPVPRQGGEQG